MHSILEAFAKHRIAPNAVMFIVIFLGLVGLNRINTQYLPDFDFSVVIVSTPWDGASAEDVQEGLAIPVEQAILNLADVDRVSTTSIEGRASMTVTLKDSAESVSKMMTEIEKAIANLQLPTGVGDSEIEALTILDPVADVLLYADMSLAELQNLTDRAEKTLKSSGISQIAITGLPTQRIEATIAVDDLLSLNKGLRVISQQLSNKNVNAPAGITGEEGVAAQIRIRNEALSSESIARKAVSIGESIIPLKQIADVSYENDENETRIYYQGLPAVKLSLSRGPGEDTLEMAEILAGWKTNFETQIPESASIHVYNEAYDFVRSRIKIILENGLGGFLVVLVVLFVFLNHRLAWWVAAGVPVSFLATFILLELTGNSINVISLLGFLIALGVIVDDAIVVGENAYANMEQGDDAETAAIKAAKKMLPAVLASSVTTIAAFLPLLLVGGTAGAFAKGVPIVIIMAIAASLIECFIILPGHLAHSFKKGDVKKPSKYRVAFEKYFNHFRETYIRAMVTKAVNYRATTFSVVVILLVLSITLVTSGRVKFVFFPEIQVPELQVSANFSEGTSSATVKGYLENLKTALLEFEEEVDQKLVETIVLETNKGAVENGGLYIQFVTNRDASITNQDIIDSWRKKLPNPANLKELTFVEGAQGPSSNGISIRLVNENIDQLMQATDYVKEELLTLNSLIEIEDDIPLGSEQLNLTLTPDAEALGLSPTALAATLRDLVDGVNVQSLQVDGKDIDVVFRIDGKDTDNWFSLAQMPVDVGNGELRPLSALAQPTSGRSIQQLSRVNGELSSVITAKKVNSSINITEVNQLINTQVRANLTAKYPNVKLELEGDQASQDDFFADVKIGGMLGALLIFIALAWVFESWTWPFAVMSAIPFALTGAIAGHWVLGLELSVLSIYGLFGLSGIIINDSIVLVSFYRDLRNQGKEIKEAVIEASVRRFRAVLLTTLTTVGGLSPLLLETSFDAQFLIPLAAVIAFGLMYGIILILFFVPAMLVSIENFTVKFKSKKSNGHASTPVFEGSL
ncbi:efflux RND transporter permease subunit [Reinekea sp.]|jgi:multidrug efflux pump subunit AcrB|uniref:efflux RND transporter permease subunit n=1 Tax=Reinekea sp. TaxID=1970455 RepID=UPI003989B3AD